jgi:hypothetical protein
MIGLIKKAKVTMSSELFRTYLKMPTNRITRKLFEYRPKERRKRGCLARDGRMDSSDLKIETGQKF